jgi:hypothetical protein
MPFTLLRHQLQSGNTSKTHPWMYARMYKQPMPASTLTKSTHCNKTITIEYWKQDINANTTYIFPSNNLLATVATDVWNNMQSCCHHPLFQRAFIHINPATCPHKWLHTLHEMTFNLATTYRAWWTKHTLFWIGKPSLVWSGSSGNKSEKNRNELEIQQVNIIQTYAWCLSEFANACPISTVLLK